MKDKDDLGIVLLSLFACGLGLGVILGCFLGTFSGREDIRKEAVLQGHAEWVAVSSKDGSKPTRVFRWFPSCVPVDEPEENDK